MTASSGSSRTESMTDLHNSYHPGYSWGYSTVNEYIAGRPTLRRQETDPTSFVFFPTTQPNRQFYCIPNTPEEDIEHFKEDDYQLPYRQQEETSRPPGTLTRRAAEVAAAARFISNVKVVELDEPSAGSRDSRRPRFGSITSVRDSILDNSLCLQKSRSASMQAYSSRKRSKAAVPPPLTLQRTQQGAEELQSPLPTRTSSKGAPSFDFVRPLGSARSLPVNISSPAIAAEPKSPLSVLTPESANTFHFDFSIPSEPSLSRSGSGATTESQCPPTPSENPSEEQLRLDIEAFVLEQGAYLRSRQRRTRRPLIEDVKEEISPAEPSLPPLPEVETAEDPTTPGETPITTDARPDDTASSSPTLRRKKSIFGWLQKKSEIDVDDLIDLYLTDEQREEDQELKAVKRRGSRPKLPSFRHRATPDPLPVKES